MDNKNIRTFWEINSPDPHAKMLYVNDAFGNGVYIEEGSLHYDPIYKAYCDCGRMSAHQIFEAFVPHKYFPANISVNEYHKTFDTSVDFSDPNAILVSGQSASTFKNLIKGIDLSAFEIMEATLSDERYDKVVVPSMV